MDQEGNFSELRMAEDSNIPFQIDIFSKDIVLIPVNYSNQHWTAAAINFRRKRLESYDSMDMAKDIVFRVSFFLLHLPRSKVIHSR